MASKYREDTKQSLVARLAAVSFNAEPTSRHRLIVGVDYGTTYSGVSFATTDKSSADDINVIRTWPGRDGEWKVPTRIAYAQENQADQLTANKWGFEVEPRMTSCSWTKLLLDAKADEQTHDDPKLQNAVDEGMLRLPPGLSAQQVCSDFLREVHKYVTVRLSRQVTEEVLKSTPMDIWLTIPAVWTDEAKDATRSAARAAGFGNRPHDSINIISEPEAAAIAALKKYTEPHSLIPPKQGENVLVCDCGGGTVDITTYNIVDVSPRLEFDEICVGVGGKCGSTYIDRNLHRLMQTRFGRAFDEIEMRRKGPGSRFMESWERVKRSFVEPEDHRVREVGPLRMKNVSSSQYYDEDESMVHLTWRDVQALFTPVVNEILSLVMSQKKELQYQGRAINRIILIGGFGDSEYLFSKLKSWCDRNGSIQLLCPEHPQAAIVRGAAIRGLEGFGAGPRKRRCRRHYGVATAAIFRDGVDPEAKAVFSQWDGRKRCLNRMHWLIRKGEEILPDTKRLVKVFISVTESHDWKTTDNLWTCSLSEPPEYSDNDRVAKIGRIETDFSTVSKSSFAHKREFHLFRSNKKIWCVEFEIEVSFGSESGVLEFRTLAGGRVVGTSSIAFE
ncbi:hypothetical protein LTR78_009564 [Recurvomyces mirabilis]|uniref:Actin-like ATPase domain-containing protein n=1 Tax=Recurvomyces mirabilis TaxID=574656 RepID=A0AAE0WFC5_9PEZI|nr:hypothetical protein LTR78_009564 [Recurvomyces mirabilis]KAK5149981.1 hypothetical protein LTS14_010453 [Recurvomyces mirabilis]